MTSRPSARKTASKAAGKLLSRSWIRKRGLVSAAWSSQARFRACWACAVQQFESAPEFTRPSARRDNLSRQMSQFEGSVVINRPIDEVWTFISDPQSASLWGRGVSEVVVTPSGPVGLGTTVRLLMSGSRMEARMIRYEAAKTFTLEFTAGPVKGSRLTYSVESVEGKTRLTRDLVMRLNGIWRLMQPVLNRREIRDS